MPCDDSDRYSIIFTCGYSETSTTMRYAVIQRSLLLTFKDLVDGGKSMTLDVTFGDTQTVLDMVE